MKSLKCHYSEWANVLDITRMEGQPMVHSSPRSAPTDMAPCALCMLTFKRDAISLGIDSIEDWLSLMSQHTTLPVNRQ